MEAVEYAVGGRIGDDLDPMGAFELSCLLRRKGRKGDAGEARAPGEEEKGERWHEKAPPSDGGHGLRS